VAVTKGFGMAVVEAAAAAGLTRLGENRVQEALPKVAARGDLEWHLIGRLQANKVRAAVRAFAVIHSVDSVALLTRIERISGEEGRRPELLLELNLTGEATHAGFQPTDFRAQLGGGELLSAITGLRHARVTGLMTIAPMGVPAAESRAWFARLRELRDALAERSGVPLPELSMGMTGDAEAAVAEGATLVRIGTALFGPRPG